MPFNVYVAGHTDAFIWPKQSLDLPDGEPRFLLGFLPLDFAGKSRAEQEREGEAARQQVLTALSITNHALNHLNQQLAAHRRDREK